MSETRIPEQKVPEQKVPEQKMIDPFKPAQPRIPGVSDHHEAISKHAADTSASEAHSAGVMGPPLAKEEIAPEKLKAVWVGLALTGALGSLLLLVAHSRNVAATHDPTHLPPIQAPVKDAVAAKPPTNASSRLPIAPGVIASKGQLAKAWSSQEFVFREQLTGRTFPAMVVRLPGGALWAFSLHTPYGSCELEYVTDLRRLQSDYDFSAGHPMVAEPCTKSVFDLTRYGNAPSGLVRGEVVKGSAFRPPLAIEVGTKNDQIVAIRSEQ
jgi:hypothetical protein